MKPKIEYEILCAKAFGENPTHEQLQEIVQAKLKEGWEPLGAPFFSEDAMYQAITRPASYSTVPGQVHQAKIVPRS